jgi:hypothetical protein
MWFKGSVFTLLGFAACWVLSGCIFSPSDMYMAEYEVRSPNAGLASFQNEFASIGKSIATDIDRRYVSVRGPESPDYFMSATLMPNKFSQNNPLPNVGMEWFRSDAVFIITITTKGPGESEDVVWIRNRIEHVLSNNSFKWRFSVTRRRSIFY